MTLWPDRSQTDATKQRQAVFVPDCLLLKVRSGHARQSSPMRKPPSAFERLYQPQKPLFWMGLVFNVLAAVMVLALHSDVLSPLALWLTAVLALSNNALGAWAFWRLWCADPASGRGDDVAVGVPSGVTQNRPNDEQT